MLFLKFVIYEVGWEVSEKFQVVNNEEILHMENSSNKLQIN